jgi:multiple sugar transport system permease protein
MVIPPVVVGLIWMFMFYTDYGIVNQFLKWIGIGGLRWLSDYSLSLLSLIIVDIWEWTPFMFLILLAALTSLPLEPYEAAEIDGASRWQTFLYVTLPMLRMPILTALLLRTIDAFKVFDIVYIMTSGGPGSSTMTLSMNTFIIAFRRFDIGKASALAFIIVAIVTVISQLYIKIIYKGEKR